MPSPSVIVIGAGPSGIAMGYNLQKAGLDSFTIYEQAAQPGGVWHLNTFPNAGCDVYSHLYSFSFALNASWSQELANQPEIERYMNATIDKLGLRAHIHCQISCIGAVWDAASSQWRVSFRDEKTGLSFERFSDVLISCVGAISVPKDCDIPGFDTFAGKSFHSARWDHSVPIGAGTRIAVIGNGCSAAQFVPRLVESGAEVTQFARSPQWYHPRPNHRYTSFEKLLLNWVPGVMRLYRLYLFIDTDQLLETYLATPRAHVHRAGLERDSQAYMESIAPREYHTLLLPTYPLGCKRRIFDPDYLSCLHSPNIDLVPARVTRIDGSTVVSASGVEKEVDVLILATGYKVQEFLTPLKIYGENGKSLERHWEESRGAQAYKGTFVSGFPNFGIIFGPNSFPAHNSVIYTAEVQAEFVRKTIIEPLIFGRARKISVKAAAEDLDASRVQIGLKGMVWEAGCSNWYLNKWGRNTASYPGFAASYWRETFFPTYGDFKLEGGSSWWFVRAAVSHLRQVRLAVGIAALVAALSFRRTDIRSMMVSGLALSKSFLA